MKDAEQRAIFFLPSLMSRWVHDKPIVWTMALLSALSVPMIGNCEDILGRMGSLEIKSAELKRILSARGIDTNARFSVEDLDKLLRDELVRRAIIDEAKAKGWDKKPETLDRMERARDDALISVYVSGISKPAAEYPSEAEIKDAYDSNKGSFVIPRQYRVAQIYLMVSEADAPDKVEIKAREVAAKATEKNADFAKLALDYSHHRESAVRGGELGWLSETQLIPEVRSAIQGVSKGAVSKPIRSSTGFHIIKLQDLKEASDRPLVEVRAQIIESLRQRRAEANGKQYVSDMIKKAPITVNQVELSKYAQPVK